MRLVVFIVVFFKAFTSEAQGITHPYSDFEKAHEAFLQFSGLQTSPALQELSQVALAYRFLDNQFYSNYATAYLADHYHRQNTDSAAYFIQKHITNCSSENELSSPLRQHYHTLVEELKKEVQCSTSINDRLVKEIYHLRDADQRVRRHFANARRGTAYFDALIAEEKINDSINYIQFTKLIEKYGIPTIENAGQAAEKLVIVIMHCREDVQDYYLEQYKILARQGKVSWLLPEQIGTSLSFMFKHGGYRFIKNLNSDWQQNLNKESKGYFELKCLYLILKANPSMSIEFYPTHHLSASHETKTDFLKNLVNFFKEKGISTDRLVFNGEQTVNESVYRMYKPLVAYKLKLGDK